MIETKVENRFRNYTDSYDLARDINKVLNTYPTRPDSSLFPYPKIGDILDEEKSIRWNREEVERLRLAYDDEVKRIKRERVLIYKEFDDKFFELLIKENGLSVEEGKIIYRKAYEDGHSCGFVDVLNHFVEFADMYNELKKVNNK